jgi:hypothetical protein
MRIKKQKKQLAFFLRLIFAIALSSAYCGCKEEASEEEPSTVIPSEEEPTEGELPPIEWEGESNNKSPVPVADLSEAGLSCSMEALFEEDLAVIRMTLHNTGDKHTAVSPLGTAWDEGRSVFSVQNDKEKGVYTGISEYRGPVEEDEYIQLAPGHGISKDYSLSEMYEIAASGEFRVKLHRAFMDVEVDGKDMLLRHDCGELKLLLTPVIATIQEDLTYTDTCSAAQIDMFERQLKPAARSMLYSVESFLTSGNPIYAEWFGPWTARRGDIVNRVFDAFKNHWDQWEIDCSPCTGKRANAFFSRRQPNTVHVCPGYWELPEISIEASSSKLGVFFHELSHLESGTADHVYGANLARALAQQYPDLAVDNAENYEHFVSHQYIMRLLGPINRPLM